MQFMKQLQTIHVRTKRYLCSSECQQDTREALILAGLVAMTERGYRATRIEALLIAVDVSKGSFYHFLGCCRYG